MRNSGHLVLDLDGTISDPAVGICRSINFALAHFGYPAIPDTDVGQFIGPPIDETFRSITRTSSEEFVTELVEKYRERYADIGYSENQVYVGIPDVLKSLASAGAPLGVCTSKRADFAQRILEMFDLRGYFEFVSGGDVGIHKKVQLRQLLDASTISRDSVMVGDRAVDVVAAKANGIRSAGVLWGYGTVDELCSAAPDHLFRHPVELLTLVHATAEH